MSISLYRNKEKNKSIFILLGKIFTPLIPAFIIAGVAQGGAILLNQVVYDLDAHYLLYLTYKLFLLISNSFTPFVSIWVGFYTCLSLGSTAILGGIIGMIVCLEDIDSIAVLVNMEGVLYSGAGGIVSAFIGACILSWVEKKIRLVVPKYLNTVITPLLVFIIILVPYIFIIMPISGFLSNILCHIMDYFSSFESGIMKAIIGFIAAAVFLPINVAGLQHGILALYPIQLEKYGYITLYPVFAMAGAGQVGAGVAVLYYSKRIKDKEFSNIIISSIIPGTLGVASPLIYGVTLPIPKAFLASCLGAGVGGALINFMGIASTGWGPSGILAIPMMVAGGMSALKSMMIYLAGLLLSSLSGFIFGLFLLRDQDICNKGVAK